MYVVPIVIEAKKWIVAVGVKSAGGKSMLLLALLELPSSWLCTHRFWKKKKEIVWHIRISCSSLSISCFLPAGILSSASLGSEESKKIKQDIYSYDLTQYCMLVLRQDHFWLHGGWATAAQLAEILR